MHSLLLGEETYELPRGCQRKDEFEIPRHPAIKSQGNRSKAARLLGISRDTLLYRIKKYAL